MLVMTGFMNLVYDCILYCTSLAASHSFEYLGGGGGGVGRGVGTFFLGTNLDLKISC